VTDGGHDVGRVYQVGREEGLVFLEGLVEDRFEEQRVVELPRSEDGLGVEGDDSVDV
jgi:hypothetical protein